MDDQAKVKDRSPNYPGLGLEPALEAVRKLYKADGTSPVPQETLARLAGHEKMSGPARSKIAAIRQYGLIESAGPGKVRGAERALPLFFHSANDKEYQQTLKELALTPALFSQLFGQYAQASEPTLRLHLIRERKFSEDGSKRLARIFKENLVFAKLGSPSYTSPESETEDEANSDLESETTGSPGLQAVPRGPVRAGFDRTQQATQLTADTSALSLDFLLGGISARLSFSRKPTPRTIQRLVAYLQLLKDDIEEQAEGQNEERTP